MVAAGWDGVGSQMSLRRLTTYGAPLGPVDRSNAPKASPKQKAIAARGALIWRESSMICTAKTLAAACSTTRS